MARHASSWLLAAVKERQIVKGQANDETCKSSGNWKLRGNEEVGYRSKITFYGASTGDRLFNQTTTSYWTVVSTILDNSCERISALQMSIFVLEVKLLNVMVLHGSYPH